MADVIAGGNVNAIPRVPILSWRFAVALLSVAIVATLLLIAPRAADARYASIVVEAGTGRVLHESNADDRNSPASLTKLMTLYMLFDAVESKRMSWNTRLKTSRHAANQSPTHLALKPGDTISAREAALALIIHSANDVAVVVAEALGETEQKFALKMTAQARKIGMSRTTFRNASGLPNSGQQSTARDMAILAQAIMDRYPSYYPMFAESNFSYRGRVYKSHNRVTGKYPGADGMKTGYTQASGFNLVTSAERNGRRLIGVVFGGNTARSRDQHMENLLDAAFAKPGAARSVVAKNTAPARSAAPVVPAKGQSTSQGDADVSRPDWGIQVGAFYTERPAEAILRDVTRKYAKLLEGGQATVMPLSKSRNRTLYRARVIGLDKETAQEACRLLKRANQPCLELKDIGDQELAERR